MVLIQLGRGIPRQSFSLSKLVLSRSKDRLLLTFNCKIKISGLFFPPNCKCTGVISSRNLCPSLLIVAGYMFVLFQDDVHLGISGGIAHNIISLFVETTKTYCFMLYINTVNGESYFKSEISLVSFSLTGAYMYFISDAQFQTLANFSRCLKCAVIFTCKFIYFPM